MNLERRLREEFARVGIDIPQAAIDSVVAYDDLLVHWNRKINLTGLREVEERIRVLYVESLWGASVTSARGTLMDVGSGCGFPGLAFKILVPELNVHLVEARRRKVHFIKEASRRLGLAGVWVWEARVESFIERWTPRLDHVVWRALSLGDKMIRRVADRVCHGGTLILFATPSSTDLAVLKGLSGYREVLAQLVPGSRERGVFRFQNCST